MVHHFAMALLHTTNVHWHGSGLSNQVTGCFVVFCDLTSGHMASHMVILLVLLQRCKI